MKLSGRTLKKHEMLRIKAFPRIHVSLIGMNRDGYRINGGIGFSVSSPTLDMSFELTPLIEVVDLRKHGFSKDELDRLIIHLYRIVKNQNLDKVCKCTIHKGAIQSHVGFGSNSMIYLSCVEALLILNHKEYTKNDVIALSGRGGTSGVGINTYFEGGYVFDCGISNLGQRSFAPSSSFVAEKCSQPLLMKSIKLPEWDLGICIPPIENKTEEEEIVFFRENCPIAKKDVEEILYEAVYGLTSSLIESDFEVFCQSINAIQQTRWKMLERNLYGKKLSDIEDAIKDAGAKCVGMSSLGPMLYFFGNDICGVLERLKEGMPWCTCFKTSFNNYGRVVKDD